MINAYLQPVVDRYLDTLEGRLRARCGAVNLRIMQASGGTMTAEAARGHAVNLVNSGPAGGTQAAALIGRLTGDRQIISVDMGGTSFDIGLIDGGAPRVTSEGEFEGYPVKIPVLDVHAPSPGWMWAARSTSGRSAPALCRGRPAMVWAASSPP